MGGAREVGKWNVRMIDGSKWCGMYDFEIVLII